MTQNRSPSECSAAFDWDPSRFGNGNYIDAMVLWRRQALLDWGLYTTDSGLYGWEDYELFARSPRAAVMA